MASTNSVPGDTDSVLWKRIARNFWAIAVNHGYGAGAEPPDAAGIIEYQRIVCDLTKFIADN